jgi:hypothetical protein
MEIEMVTVKEKIALHEDRAKTEAALAASYARTGHYKDAAESYYNAAFHQDIVDELKSCRRAEKR